MKATKAFHVVGCMIADHENFIIDSQEFIAKNKGNSKLQSEVKEMKAKMLEHQKMVKPLYRIRNAFYGV